MSRECLERVGKRRGAATFFWGYLFEGEGGRLWAKLHLWQQGEDRAFALPYDEASPRRLAERLYRHVLAPGKVGNVRLLAPADGPPARGELVVNGRPVGFTDGALEARGGLAGCRHPAGTLAGDGQGVFTALAGVPLPMAAFAAP